jgi:ketoreductase RED2
MTNRVVLVTGSTSGIGEATALRFAGLGDTVVFNSVRSVAEGERLASATPGSSYIQGDVAVDADCARLVREVLGTWNLSVHAMDALRDAKGSIVNVSSLAGVRPVGSSIPYAASKAAVNHMTTLLAKVVGPEVRVNAVAPGLVDTPWTKDWDTVRGFVSTVAPLKRSGTPDDIADVIVSLALSPYVTGQVVVVDGGLSLTT